MKRGGFAAIAVLAACQSDPLEPVGNDASIRLEDGGEQQQRIDTGVQEERPLAIVEGDRPEQGTVVVPASPKQTLEIKFLGVGGFSIKSGDDRVLSAPLYSNPPLDDVLRRPIRSDSAAIERFLSDADVESTKAILVGHAHYDHLMDVPYVLEQMTPDARIYGNVDMQRLLAAFAPDKAPGCPSSTVSVPLVPRDRVVALNDPANDRVDYRMCSTPQGRCDGAWDGGPGEWVGVPSSRVRLRALCSSHPDQFLIFHLGEGCVDEEQCTPPPRASDWREGSTVAYLIDFLDERGAPVFRVYYQDAPTNGPVGYPHPDLLAEKRIDVALLCVGSYDQVTDQPQDTIRALSPRFVIAGHWESFFRQQDQPLADLPFLNVGEYMRRLNAATSTPADTFIKVNGQENSARGYKPDPGTVFEVEKEP